jgi:hypothetical protein
MPTNMGVLGRDSMSDVTQRKNVLQIKLQKKPSLFCGHFKATIRRHFVAILPVVFVSILQAFLETFSE